MKETGSTGLAIATPTPYLEDRVERSQNCVLMLKGRLLFVAELITTTTGSIEKLLMVERRIQPNLKRFYAQSGPVETQF